ncbi:MAG: uroporphyrinogen-III synthase [Verrucomicrobia bacterium]|nr:uroporphyrinogen-III synthase [Verrucomicrobiota bacterium]
MKPMGTVYLVGAGPGDPGLLTVRGAELMRRADALVCDATVHPDLLHLARPDAERIWLARAPAAEPPSRTAAIALMVARASAGQCVVRLSSGDSYVFGSCGDEAEALARAGIPFEVVPGVLPVAGDAVAQRSKLNWFERRPLFGRRVVVTRAAHQIPSLKRPLAELGADVLEVPCIRIGPTPNRRELVDALGGLGEYDWLVFTSANGVHAFFDYFFKAFEDVRSLGALRLAAVGPGTAAALEALHLKVDVVPKEALGSAVAKALGAYESMENLKVLLMRAQKANPDLPRALSGLGAIVDDIACYQTLPETGDATGDAARLLAEGAEWATFTSGSTVDSFHARFDLPGLLARFPRMRLASIGPETTKALAALGLTPALEAREHTIDGLVKALALGARHP